MQVSIDCLNLCYGCHQTITPHYLRGQSVKGQKNARFVACQAIQLSGSTGVISTSEIYVAVVGDNNK